jgi:hypothetical protein
MRFYAKTIKLLKLLQQISEIRVEFVLTSIRNAAEERSIIPFFIARLIAAYRKGVQSD